MLFTAIAGTVVILPWALPSTPFDEDRRPLAEQTQMSQLPLTDLGGGETIREVHQETPFSLVALTAADLDGTSARVRARKSDGSWGPWYEAEPLDGVGDGSSSAPRGTEPVFVGLTTTVQIAVNRPGGATSSAPQKPAVVGPADPDLGYIPANTNQPFGQNVNAVLISPPQAPIGDLPLPNAVTPPG
ncbi:MAG TPA: cold-shock protein, partial [Mycobacterium sp.]|nr:cold-shock protein [Mycobacterium sp.]